MRRLGYSLFVIEREQKAFAELMQVCRRLRGPGGCPWDREQTLESMTPYLIEEAFESVDAIGTRDAAQIAEELGDLVFLAIFCMELLAERQKLSLAECLERAAQKLIRRHPHVYGDADVKDGDAAFHQWQKIKKEEQGSLSLLGEQPKSLPALTAAYRVQEKAAAVGFDWPAVMGALAKVREEMHEVEEAQRGASSDLAREIGDLLFAAVNVARHVRVDPERELRDAIRRFRERFQYIEQRLAERGTTPAETSLEEMDSLWNESKLRSMTAQEIQVAKRSGEQRS
jgi:MazG family protein